MKIVELRSVTERLFNLREAGNYPGVSTGYSAVDPYYTVRLGNTTIITGIPTSGKTQWYLQMLCNLTYAHQWRHIVYSPETGTPEEIYAEIIHCITGKSFNKNFYNYISEPELMRVKDYVQDYFKVLDPDDAGDSFEDWLHQCREVMRSCKIHTVGIDNWNDLEHDMSRFGNKVSEYLKRQLPIFNRFAKIENVHGFLLAHPRSPDMKGRETPPAPRPDEIEGGSLWYAKAQSILTIHRDWSDPNNHTSQIIIGKAKPKIIGKKGLVELEFDRTFNCYFEKLDNGDNYPESQFKENGRPIFKDKTYEQKLEAGRSDEIDRNVPY